MNKSELSDVVERAQHLLWVIARRDVESLSERPTEALRRLSELEGYALELGVTDLYQEVLRDVSDAARMHL